MRRSDHPRVIATGPDGEELVIEADFVVGADGSRSVARAAVTGSSTGGYFREYPFAWFGILCEAPPSSEELIYSRSDEGFALISQRSATVQRMYFQCDVDDNTERYSEAQLWDELQKRVPGTELKQGTIFQRDILRFRSFVAHKLLEGRVALIGDAAHTVPPTGAKGMNLAIADVVVLDGGAACAPARGRRPARAGLPRDRAAAHLEGAALLLVDDLDAPRRARRVGVRPPPPDRRAAQRGGVRGRQDLPRRGVHRLASRRSFLTEIPLATEASRMRCA